MEDKPKQAASQKSVFNTKPKSGTMETKSSATIKY